MPYNVGIFVFENVATLDFAGPHEVFTTASRIHDHCRPWEPEPFDVFTVGRTLQPVRAREGLDLYPEYDFLDHPNIDLLVIPGGVITEELDTPAVAAWIASCFPGTQITASVCTGAFLLAQAGLLTGKSATTHWEKVEYLQAMFPSILVVKGKRLVDEGKLVTSSGLSAGIDMSLHLVGRLVSYELAQKTARQLEFDWVRDAGIATGQEANA